MPLIREGTAQWRDGGPPLWNPYQALGAPLLATLQAGCAYPLNALYLVFDPGGAWFCTTILHDAIAGLGLFALCRGLGLSRSAALVGAASFAFSWLILLKCYDQPQFVTLAWLPALFVCAERLVASPKVGAALRLAVVWALQLLAGHPETIAYCALLLGVYTGVRVLAVVWRAPRQALLAAAGSAGAAGLALALTAFQWIPTWELVQHSVRAVGSLTAAQQSLGAADVWEIFSTPPGCAMLAIALAGLITWRQRTPAWFFAGAAVAVAAVACGPSTRLFELTRWLPTGTWFRSSGRVLMLWPLCVGVLTAAGAELFTENAPVSGPSRTRLILLCLIVTLAARVLLSKQEQLGRALGLAGIFDLAPLLTIAVLSRVSHRVPALLRQHVDPILVLVFFCCAPPLFNPRLTQDLSPRRVSNVYSPYTALFDGLRATVPARVLSLLSVGDAHTWAKLGTYFEVPVLNDLEPLSLQDFQAFRISLSGTNPLWRSAVFMGEVTPPQPRFDARWLNLSGVRFVLADAGSESRLPSWFSQGIRLVPRTRSAGVAMYENRTALPRAFFVAAGNVRPQGPHCTETLQDPYFDPTRELLLDGPSPAAVSAATQPISSAVRISTYRPSEVRLQVTTDQPGIVLLTDAFFPGWTADVDGVAVPVLRGDCFFRAVPVQSGAHTVTFRYFPPSFRWGLSISVAAFGMIMAGMFCSAWRARSAGRTK